MRTSCAGKVAVQAEIGDFMKLRVVEQHHRLCSGLALSELFFDPLVRRRQVFGQHAGFGDHAHEVGVGDPSWQDMHVDVPGHAGARGLTQVHPQVETVRLVELAENAFQLLRQLHHFLGRGRGEFQELVRVLKWNHHDMTVGVRECVQNDEAVPAAMDDHVFFVIASRQNAAKQAAGGLVCRGNVSVTPGSKQEVHAPWKITDAKP